jgi:O-antigen/teichoic acid export membrane protein
MALRNVLLVGMPVAATLAALAPGIVTFLYGEDYRPVATLLSIMITVYTFTATRKVAWAALRGLGDRRWAVAATGIAAAINLAGAAILIPRYHLWGAVAGNTLAQLVATVIAFVVLSRVYGCRVPVFDFARITWAGVLAYGAMVTMVPGPASLGRLVLGGAVGLVVYAGALVIMRVITTREWQLAVSMLNKLTGRHASATPKPPAPSVTPVPTEV